MVFDCGLFNSPRKYRFFLIYAIKNVRLLSSLAKKSEPKVSDVIDVSEHSVNDELTPNSNETALTEKYEEIKDLSRMKNWHRCLLHNQATSPNEFKWQQERWAQKERYAKYGKESGVDPGLMWPTQSELREKALEEDDWSPKLAETIRAYQEKAEAQAKARRERLKIVDENLKKYPNLMKDYLAKVDERRRAVKEAVAQREETIQEIRNYFGYAISESDPRFKVKLMMRREEEKSVSRIAKKKEKQAQMLEKLQSMTASLASQMVDTSAPSSEQIEPAESKPTEVKQS